MRKIFLNIRFRGLKRPSASRKKAFGQPLPGLFLPFRGELKKISACLHGIERRIKKAKNSLQKKAGTNLKITPSIMRAEHIAEIFRNKPKNKEYKDKP